MKFIKKNLRVVIAVVVATIMIVVCMFFLIKYDKEDKLKKQENIKEQITEVTGMTSDDAISIVKEAFFNGNYEFKAEVTNDRLYKVVVVNVSSEQETVYYVDPNTKQTYIDIDTK